MSQLITLKNITELDFTSLKEKGKEVKQEINKYKLSNQVVTLENLNDMKALRAKLNKEFKEYEETRMALKKAIEEPYKQFNKVYKDNIEKHYKDAEFILKQGVDSVQQEMLDERIQYATNYFDEVNTHSFLTYSMLNQKVTRAMESSKIEKEIDAFLQKVDEDLKIIETQQNKERILIKYYSLLDVNKSIIDVTNEIQAEEALKKQIKENEKTDTEPTVEQVEVVEEIEEVHEMTFTVYGSITELKLVKNFLEAKGIEYK